MSAVVVRIDVVRPHPNADRLGLAWVRSDRGRVVPDVQCVVVLGTEVEGYVGEGDLAIFVPVGMLVPVDVGSPFAFLHRPGHPATHVRVMARRFRGEVSNGLLVPAQQGMVEGQDVTAQMGCRYSRQHPEPWDVQATRNARTARTATELALIEGQMRSRMARPSSAVELDVLAALQPDTLFQHDLDRQRDALFASTGLPPRFVLAAPSSHGADAASYLRVIRHHQETADFRHYDMMRPIVVRAEDMRQVPRGSNVNTVMDESWRNRYADLNTSFGGPDASTHRPLAELHLGLDWADWDALEAVEKTPTPELAAALTPRASVAWDLLQQAGVTVAKARPFSLLRMWEKMVRDTSERMVAMHHDYLLHGDTRGAHWRQPDTVLMDRVTYYNHREAAVAYRDDTRWRTDAGGGQHPRHHRPPAGGAHRTRTRVRRQR